MRYLISLDINEASAATALAGLKAAGKVARIARVRNGVANIDVLASKGDNPVSYYGAKFNSARKYKFNDKTFLSKGLKAQTKTVTVWS